MIEFKLPGQNPEKIQIGKAGDVPALLQAFADRFATTKAAERPVRIAQGLFGYTAYDAVSFLKISLQPSPEERSGILVRYRLYQYLIAIDHFRDELFICENQVAGIGQRDRYR